MNNKTRKVSALDPMPTVGNSKNMQRNTFKVKKSNTSHEHWKQKIISVTQVIDYPNGH